MWGFVSAEFGIAGAVSEILGLSGGDLTLGGVTLADLAVPAKITWGGHQRLVRHVAPGGTVVTSSLGPDWRPISWSGVIEGVGASARANQLYAMMLSAEAIPLSWLDQLWIVVIQEFSADDTTISWVPYRITCAISADPSQVAGMKGTTLLDQVLGDISSALSFGLVDSTGAITPVVTAVQQQANAPNALTFGSASSTALAAGVGTAQATIDNVIAETETSLASLGGSEVSGATSGLAWIYTAGAAAANLASAVAANGLMGRIAANLNGAST